MLLDFTPTDICDIMCTEHSVLLEQRVACGMLHIEGFVLKGYCRASQLIGRYADMSSALRPMVSRQRGSNRTEVQAASSVDIQHLNFTKDILYYLYVNVLRKYIRFVTRMVFMVRRS